MNIPVELIPLKCLRCGIPIPADPVEIAWVCEVCQFGQQLTDDGLAPLKVHYSDGISPAQKGVPFWVCEGKVTISRDTFRSSGKLTRDAQQFWSQPRIFTIPAYEYPLEALTRMGSEWLRQPPILKKGEPVSFEPVTVSPIDVSALAEFIVMAVEAERKDKVKAIHFSLKLDELELWILP